MLGSALSKAASSLPVPRTLEQAGKKVFSEVEAIKHVNALTEVGSQPATGSKALHPGYKYIIANLEGIKEAAPEDAKVEIDFVDAKSGDLDLKDVVVRILPKNVSEVIENSVLISAHIDTVFSAEGAGDDTSNVAVMLELARSVSQHTSGFKNAVIFLFNTGEEEGLNGAHSFITQHPWNETIRVAIDLEALGVGRKSGIFQVDPTAWGIEKIASVAKYPSGQIQAQDLFASGNINSTTDFQIYKETGGLSGLDFAFTDQGAVYHTKNDKLKLLKPGSLQHLGDNMLPFLLQVASSPLIK